MCQAKIPLKRFDEQFVEVFFSPVAVNEKLANVYADNELSLIAKAHHRTFMQ